MRLTICRDNLEEGSAAARLWAPYSPFIYPALPIAFRTALSPAPFPLQNALQRTPAFVRAKTLQGRAPSFDEPFIAAGAIATRAEKILLGLPSHPLLPPQKRVFEPCGAPGAACTAFYAFPFPAHSRGTFAALSIGATSSPRGDTPRRSIAATDDPADRCGCNP